MGRGRETFGLLLLRLFAGVGVEYGLVERLLPGGVGIGRLTGGEVGVFISRCDDEAKGPLSSPAASSLRVCQKKNKIFNL